MSKRAKVSITLPGELLRQVDLLRRTTGETRSEFFCRSAAALLREEERRLEVRRYVEGYLRYPEDDAEGALYDALTAEALAEVPWEPDRRPREAKR